jgi:outer membrane protein OmpA-like peptidoglycan-associated protein
LKRLESQGYGFTQPVSLNGTSSGREMNRRVELDPY